MRAVRHTPAGIEVLDVPEPPADTVVVEVAAAGICGSDLHLLGFGSSPVTLGHEIGGRLGDGTPVAVWPARPCGACDRCAAGASSQCRAAATIDYGIGADGGMADRIGIDARNVVPVPEGVSPRDAALVEPIACGVHALRRAGVRAGDRVAVIGAGSIGLGAAAVAGWLGCPVDVMARHDAQVAAARAIGAGTDVAGEYDVVVEAAGTTSSTAAALAHLRPGGTVAVVASHWEPVTLPQFFTVKEPTIVTATMHGETEDGHDMVAAARLLGDRPEVPAALVTHRVPLDRAADGFRIAADRAAGAIKVVLEP